jgi:predicted phage terminase large subunit-like protein
MQRLHQDDLSSQLLSCGDWDLLKIPMVAPRNMVYDIGAKSYQFKLGNILNSKRDSHDFVDKIERDMVTRNYAAQFLQNPLPSNYNLLSEEDISFYQEAPENFDYYIQSWDTALKTTEKSDFSVGTCWGIVGEKYYLLSMIRKKLAYPELKQTIEKFSKRFSPKYILIEDKASGQSIIQDLQYLDYTNIKPIRPKLDKVTRFAATIDLFQIGKVLLPLESSFKRKLLRELTGFPNSKNDDIVDSVSQFLNFSKEINPKKIVRMRVI